MGRVRSVAGAVAALGLFASGVEVARAAEDDDLVTGVGVSAIQRVVASGTRGAAPVSLALGSGYGYTESVLGKGDAHHRLLGTLAVEVAPVQWLGVGLRLDGRYDRHTYESDPSDDGWMGEPRLYVRGDRRVGERTSLGARALVWLPGARAPSIVPSAAATDLLGVATWSPGALVLHGNLGYRLDRSDRAVPDIMSLGPGDRLALGVSGFDAALIGLGAGYRRPGWQLFAEWSWDLLVGTDAPPPFTSPMRFGVGMYARLARWIGVEVLGEVSPSARPHEDDASVLPIPVPPRLGIRAGLVVGLGAAPPAPAAPPPAETEIEVVSKAEPPPLPPPAPPAQLARVQVEVAAEGAQAPPSNARVVLRRDGREWLLAGDGNGRFALSEAEAGPAEIAATADGYQPTATRVVLDEGTLVAVKLTLRRQVNAGQIRGFVRSFSDGGPVAAKVTVVPASSGSEPPTELHTVAGWFRIDVPGGTYNVTVAGPGYAPQERTVHVEPSAVTILNVDLKKAR